MYAAVLAWFVAQLGSALGCAVIGGYPSWGQPALTPPLAALELRSWLPDSATRVGQGQPRHSVTWRIYLFGPHEPGLLALVQACAAWAKTAGRASTAADQPFSLALTQGQRYDPLTDASQERYAFWFDVTTIW
jgi:hypothetical protein